MILLAGALGAMVAVLRSFSWYVGHNKLQWDWVISYVLRPLVGATLSTIFFVLIRGGFAQDLNKNGSYGFVALAALIGLFSEQAAEKLKTIATTIFQPAPQGAGNIPPKPPAPTASGLSQPSGPLAGGTSVTVSGSGFAQAATVSFGGKLVSGTISADGKTATVTTPAGAQQGNVPVEVRNPDGQAATVPGGFTYQ